MSRKKYTITATAFDKRGKPISTAENNYKKTHPLMSFFGKQVGLPEKIYLHAEVAALLRAGDREVHTLKIERYNNDGTPALAKPCPVCQKAIEYFGVKKIVYTSDLIVEEY